jgi:4-cresol dehydrogenase (hydroxylating)
MTWPGDTWPGDPFDLPREAALLAAANRTTLASDRRLAGVVAPGSAEELRAVLRAAVRDGLALHPVSTSRNWGYGSRRPHRNGAILVSLAALDAIEDYDEVTGTVVVGPGVTFAALAAFLASRGGRFQPPRTGSSPGSSVVGNIAERGIGKDLYEDMAGHLVGLAVMTADGGLHEVGPMRGPILPPAGPDLRGLFVQGNLGIVLRARIRLALTPPVRQVVAAALPSHGALAAFVEASRAALQIGDPWLRVEIVNAARAVAQDEESPGAPWLAYATVWGKGPEDLALRARTAANLLGRCGTGLEVCAPDDGPPAAPSTTGLHSAYHGKPFAMPDDPDPDRDRCGVLWVTANLRHHGGEVAGITEAFETIMSAHGFAPALSLRAIDGRSLRLVAGLFGDRDRPGDDARATACAEALHALMARNGIPVGRRTSAQEVGQDLDQNPGDARLARALKRALDPDEILAPGRGIPAGPPLPGLPLTFGGPPDDPVLDDLARQMAADLDGLVAGLPEGLARDARAALAAYAGKHPTFFGLYYRPTWSFLARVALPGPAARHRPRLRRLHALTLFLHLWDDHLADGQLAPTLGRIHLRSRAWSAMEDEAAALSRAAGLPDAPWRDAAAAYLEAVGAPPEPADLDAALALARREAALCTIAPGLHAALAGEDAAALARIIEDFAVAWRIVDDLQDIGRDAAAGRRSTVRLALTGAAAGAWDAAGVGDPRALAALAARLGPAVPGLVARAQAALDAARAVAQAHGWRDLAADLAASRVVIPDVAAPDPALR